jgi:hypothetical protein
MGRLLEPDERRRFAAYCRQQVESCGAIARVMQAMPNLKAVADHERVKATAYAVVATDLEMVEDVTVAGPQGDQP